MFRSTSPQWRKYSTILKVMSPEAKAEAARRPTFADGMSTGQTRMIGTKHQPTKAPTLPRYRYRGTGATTAQPYAMRIARKSQPAFFIEHDLGDRPVLRPGVLLGPIVEEPELVRVEPLTAGAI